MRKINYSKLKRKIIKGFDEWSETYTEDVNPKLSNRGHGYNSLAQNILDFLRPDKDSIIFELGVGSGVLGKEIKLLRPDLLIYGFDISEGMLKKSKETEVYYELIRCDVENIPIQNNVVNYIYSAFMFHSVLDSTKSLIDIRRIMKDNGRLIMVDLFRMPMRIPVFSRLSDNIHSMRYEFGAFSNYHRPIEFERKVLDVNFKVEKQFQIGKTKKYTHFFFGITK
ncbi:class I SAM-dependent methyltransferase [Rummeliibacillus suwonensis]|uniref:class I SAM-dependent methyltransferase n=1 Tax=Rummeliibacillus suwonensis TaxID=1306154 RepID=UPI002897CA00|nr:class I SAM-dependent methyltransferase [Rummeliibacillus suwonensis]